MCMPVIEAQGGTGEGVIAAPSVPLRGTQSFVGVMGQVWRRPGLLAGELLWRWGAGVPLSLLAGWAGSRALGPSFGGVARLAGVDVLLRPAEAATVVSSVGEALLRPLLPMARWFPLLAMVVWTVASTVGRTWSWRRLDPALRPRLLLVGILGLLRSTALLATITIWVWGLARAGQFSILRPAQERGEPNLVLYAALAVGLTLLLFMLWSVSSWVLDTAPLYAMDRSFRAPGDRESGFTESLAASWNARTLRSKLIETNLVMGIVKVALLVLAMVFSASPLPFVSVETPAFLRSWWSFVGILFLVSLDFFHVVRRAAYVQLFRLLVTPRVDTPPDPEPVS